MIIIFLLIMIAIFIGISYLISLYGGVHYVGSGDNIYRRALKLASLKSGDTFIELGSGYGKGLLIAAENDLVQAVGVEISPFHYLISRLKTHKKRNIKIVLADYRKISFRGAKVVYCYLLPKQLKYLSKKFRDELPKDARVVSYAFCLPGKSPKKVLNTDKSKLYLYQY